MSTFSFGNPTASTSTSGGGLFGSAPKPPAAPTFGGFTTPNPQQSQPGTSGGLFGSTTQQPSTGGLFGNASTAPPAGGTGLFGSTAQSQPAPSAGGLFGQSSGAPASGAGGGLFGGGTSTAPAPAPSGGLFGNTSQNAGSTGGLFGQAQNQTKPGGLFASAPIQPPGGGGLFGPTSQAAAAPSGGLFGSTAQPSQPPGGLFGNTTQPSGGLFGSATSQPAQPAGLFGSTAQAPSLFGQSTMQAPGQQQSQQGLFGSTSTAPNLSASILAPRQEVPVEERMMQIQRAWDTNNPECRFKYFFYNVVEAGTSSRYGRPVGATDEGKWVKAIRENPDPNTMVPVLATGWSDLQKRVTMQEQVAAIHQEKIKEITAALAHLTRQTTLSSSIRLTALQSSLATLLTRLIHLAGLTPALTPSLQSTAWKSEEAETKSLLEGVKSELDGKKPKGASIGLSTSRRNASWEGRMIGQVNELWGQVEEVRRYRHKRATNGEREGWMGDERALGEVADILAQQQIALQKLTELVNNALFDADVIRQGLGSFSGDR